MTEIIGASFEAWLKAHISSQHFQLLNIYNFHVSICLYTFIVTHISFSLYYALQ